VKRVAELIKMFVDCRASCSYHFRAYQFHSKPMAKQRTLPQAVL